MSFALQHRLTRWLIVALIGLAAVLGGPSPARASEPYIDRVVVTNTSRDVLVYFSVADALHQDQVFKAVLAGVPTTFTYFLELTAVHSFWPDDQIAEHTIRRTIKYDTVTEKFTVITHSDPPKEESTTDWIKAQGLMTDVVAFKVIDIDKLKKDQTYRLRIRAQIHKPELPLGLKIFFFWVPLGDLETEWYEIDFKR